MRPIYLIYTFFFFTFLIYFLKFDTQHKNIFFTKKNHKNIF